MAVLATEAHEKRASSKAANGSGQKPALDTPNIGARLRQALQQYNAALDGAAKDRRRQQTRYEVLEALAKYQPCSQTGITDHTGIDRSTLATTVGLLLKNGMIKRHRTKDDERAYAVEFTAAGRKALGLLRKRAAAVDEAVGRDILKSLCLA